MRTLVFVTILALLAGTAASTSSAIRADEGNIQVIEAKAESQFPDGIKFTVVAKSVDVIDEIRVFFSKVDQKGRSAYRSVDFEPGATVTGESLLPAGLGGTYFSPSALL